MSGGHYMAYLEPDDWVDKLVKFCLKLFTFYVFWREFPPEERKK